MVVESFKVVLRVFEFLIEFRKGGEIHGAWNSFRNLRGFFRRGIRVAVVLLEHPTTRIAFSLVTGRCDTSTSISPHPPCEVFVLCDFDKPERGLKLPFEIEEFIIML